MNISSKLPQTGVSIFTTISALAQKEQAINLGQGFPNFEVDPILIDAVHLAMKNGHNQYAPMQGDTLLREKIAEIIDQAYHRKVNTDQITVTAGATQAIFNTITAFVKQDDEVIIIDPAYDCYAPAVVLSGGAPIRVQMDVKTQTIPKEEILKKLNRNTKMIVWNNPHNPSGNVFGEDEIQFLEKIANNHPDLIFLSDEVYEHIDFTDKFKSFHTSDILKERSVIVSSFGKTFHATGWKMGYAVGEEALMKEFNKVHQYNVFAVNHPVQKGLANYINYEKTQISEMYGQKRDYLLDGIKQSNLKPVGGGGTYFQLLDYSEVSDASDVDFVQELILKNKIATIPVSVFNSNNLDQKVVRVCFAKTKDVLDQSIEILCKI